MKSIKEKDFNFSMGILIDVRKPLDYIKDHNHYSVNIPYDKLLLNHDILLDKHKKYFIICKNGIKSKKVVRILTYYGYDVTNVII